MNVGTLTILLGVTTSGINKAIRDVNRLERTVDTSAGNMNAALLSFGRVMTQFGTFPLTVFGAIAVKTFSDFEAELSKVTGLVGIAANQTAAWGEEIKALAPAVAKGPKELAEALYFVTTGGIRGAETMDVLSLSAKAAAAGLGETKTVADLVVSAMNAYGKENLSAARATDILIASVKEGKAEAPALAQSIGIVLPIASKLGASFDQVGAAMAAMTRTGTKAATAGMQTRQMLNQMVKPSIQAEKAIKTMGTSFEELRHIIGTEGILPALLKINEVTKDFGIEAVAKVFPNIRALAGGLDILGNNLEENIKTQEVITNSTGALNHAFETVSKTWKFQLNQTIKQGQIVLLEWGEAISKVLIPMVKNLLETFSDWAKNFNELSEAQQKFRVTVGLLVAAMGPLMIIFSVLRASVLPVLVGLYFGLEKAMGGSLAVMTKTATKTNIFTSMIVLVTAKLKAAWVVILKFAKAIGMMIARFAMVAGFVAIIAIVVTALIGWARGIKKVYDAQEELNKAHENATRAILTEKAALDNLVKTATSEFASKDMRAQAVRRLNELAPEYLRNLTEENARTKEGKKLIDDYTKSIEARNKQTAITNRMAEVQIKRIEDLTTGRDKELTFWDKANAMGVVYAATGTSYLIPYLNARKNAMKEAQLSQEKALRAEKEYVEVMYTLNDALLKAQTPLKNYAIVYEYLAEQVEKAKDLDKLNAKNVLGDIESQNKALKNHLKIVNEVIEAKLKENKEYQKLSKNLKSASGIERINILAKINQLAKETVGFEILTRKELQGQIANIDALETRLKSFMPELFDMEEYEASAGYQLQELWSEYLDGLSKIERAHKLFGDSYDAVTKKNEARHSYLMKVMVIEGSLSDANVLKEKEKYDISKLILDTQQSYNDRLGEAADAAIELNDIYHKQYDAQNESLNALEQAEKIMSRLSLQENETLGWLVAKEDLVRIKELEQVMVALEEAGLTMLPIYKALAEVLKGMEIAEDVRSFTESMDNLNLRMDLIGSSTELLEAKLQLLKEQYRRVLRGPIENTEKWINSLIRLRKQISKTELKIETMKIISSGLADVFISIADSAGKAMAGAENAFQGLLVSIVNIVKRIGEVLIGVGTAMLMIPGLQGVGMKYVLGGAAIVALTSAASYAMEKAQENKNVEKEAWTGMARGGIVPQGYPNDSYPAKLTSGEMVIPPNKLPDFERENQKLDITIHGEVKGQDIYYVVKEISRKYENAYGN